LSADAGGTPALQIAVEKLYKSKKLLALRAEIYKSYNPSSILNEGQARQSVRGNGKHGRD